MKAREAANEYRKTRWIQMFTEKVAGETIDKFCERNGVSRAQYFYWQRKLREAACRTALQTQNEALSSENALIPQGWTVCKPNKSESGLIVEVGNYRVSIGENFNPQLLSQVCKVLVSLC